MFQLEKVAELQGLMKYQRIGECSQACCFTGRRNGCSGYQRGKRIRSGCCLFDDGTMIVVEGEAYRRNHEYYYECMQAAAVG